MDFIYSMNQVYKILADFYTLTHFRVAIFDSNFQELVAYPTRLCHFCKIIRSDDALNETCRACDYNGFLSCKKDGQPIIYKCHMGLYEIIVPIKSGTAILGYIMCGQIFSKEANEDNWSKLLYKLKNYTLDFNLLEKSYYKSQRFTENALASSKSFMEIIGFYLYNSGCLSINQNTLEYKFDHYIIEHIDEPLDVSTLCKEFNYQKTTFYKVTNEIYGTGIMKHIRHMRVQAAKNLLSTTNLHISDISNMVGIEDYNYFTKVFKSETKCTPREYRKNSITSMSNSNIK